MVNTINMGFNSRHVTTLVTEAQQVITAMTGNASFPAPWPAPVPALAQITTDLNALQGAITATSAGDKTQIAERNAAASTLATDLLRLARYVELSADGDASKLASSGFTLRSPGIRRQVIGELSAPGNLTLSHGALSGQLMVKATRLNGAGSYEVQLATADPTVEANWSDVATYKNCSRIQLNGLTAGKTYSVRMRGIGSAGPGSWAPAVSLMSM